MVNYNNLTLEEIETKIEENDKILKEIWDTDDGNSYERWRAKCQPYWDDNEVLYTAKSMKEIPEMKPLSDFDKKCLMTIKEFKACCEIGGFINSDGFGYYATNKEVSNIEALPSAFVNGQIRTDFTHICWYNK